MKVKYMIIFVLALVLFIMGCQSDGQQLSGHYKFTGPSAIVVSFAEDAPTEASNYYFGDDPILVEVELKNLGIKTIAQNDIKLKFRGLAADNSRFTGNKGIVHPESDLTGIDINGYSETIIASMGDISYKLPIEELSIDPEIEAEICYNYVANIKPDFYITLDPTKLTNTQIKTGDNPPSPVQITALTVSGGQSDTMRFEFVVKNVGNGGIVNECFAKQERTTRMEEWVTVNFEPGDKITCSNFDSGNKIKLRNGEKRVRCEIQVDPSNVDYSKTVPIDLGFTYETSILKEIEIVRP